MMNQSHLEANQTIAEPHKIWVEPQPEPAIYKHQPLNSSSDEIRLLKLRKSNEGPLCCEIQIFPLRQAPEYIALSYRWGPPSPLHDIFVGDQRLKIRDILNSCLLELREDVDAWLWIDQMCIAQADTTERNHQVGMMSRIYSNATSVIIWLSDDLDAGSIIVLLNNIYFTRLWIVQEILLAKSVRIYLNGKRCVAWKKLQNEYSTMLKLVGLGTMPRAIFGLMNYTRKRWGSKPQLAWTRCISNFSANACGDARDKVYAMMGIVDEEDRLTVDYNKSVLEVFLDVV
ncbi:heterokaryon incompatibility protein-domain-containing protein, partial [Alternaria rosae]|uniref:heterokaryon incompatibility protein-domain-containing protein n=1 Tax=Alternaria rosae TaxID=1187941 RepID=UPI001E8D0726